MKKFYTLALVAVLGTSASFAGQRQLTVNNIVVKAQVEQAAVKAEKSSPAKAPAKVASIAELNGTYDWAYSSRLSSKPNPELVITIDDEATGAATISGFPQGFEVKATVDLSKNTISIANNQDLGKDGNGDANYFYLKSAGSDGKLVAGASAAEATVGTIDGTSISFPALDIWAIGDPANEAAGYWMLTYSNVLTYQKEKVLYGVGTVSGDMFFSAFGKTAADYQVDVYKDDETGDKLLVKDPLKGLYAAYGWDEASPAMIIDATDPANLVIPEFSLGINGGDEDGLYYGLSYSANMQDITSTPAANRITLTKDEKSAVITIPVKSLFLWPSNTTKLYYVNIEDAITITIALAEAGVDDIVVDEDSNAPVEYYNLQGVRVAEPAAGQLVIRRQGNKATKLLVK